MQATNRITRQGMGCGYESPPVAPLRAMPWQPPLGPKAYRHGAPSMCVGYLTNLPEVREAVVARVHWKQGQLAESVEGKPSELLLDTILILEGENASVERWAFDNPEPKS